jgi:hypothetical protein
MRAEAGTRTGSTVAGLVAMGIAVAVLTGCGVQATAAAGVSEQACRTLGAARSEVAKLARGADERTVGDVRARLGWIEALLVKARAETTGIAQVAVASLQTSLGPAQQSLAALPDDAALTRLPAGFSGSRTGAQYRFDDLWLKVGCPEPSPA